MSQKTYLELDGYVPSWIGAVVATCEYRLRKDAGHRSHVENGITLPSHSLMFEIHRVSLNKPILIRATRIPKNSICQPHVLVQNGTTFAMQIASRITFLLTLVVTYLIADKATFAGPVFANAVEDYAPGTDTNPAYSSDAGIQAIGPPTRDTGFGSQVGVFYPAFQASELTQIGAGGSLTVSFADPIENDPANPFGIDLLVFGNAYYLASGGVATGPAFAEPALISVSQNNIDFFEVPGVFGDTGFPTLGFQDTVYSGFSNSGGTILTDFSKPVDPLFDATGLTEAEINSSYRGSGGGTGVDIGSVGLDWIQYIRVSLPIDADYTAEIDAFSDVAAVPEPSFGLLLSVAVCLAGTKKRRRRPS